MRQRSFIIIGVVVALTGGCVAPPKRTASDARNCFVAVTNFSNFEKSSNGNSGEIVLTSPEIVPSNTWDELIVSWNAPSGAYLTMEVRGISAEHATKYYMMGLWSDDSTRHPRESVTNQADADGTVKTDTLVLERPAAKAQLRIALGTTIPGGVPLLKFVGLSFCNTGALAAPDQPNVAARGKILAVPERVQSGYEGPGGWCSPASLSMVLAYWSQMLHRPELDLPVPEVAAAVNDPVYGGTGNWPFNTAFAGSFPGMRAYVTRLDNLSELENWIAAGVPVVLSVSSYLTNDRQDGPDNGHLIVCAGFTPEGDVVVNDPGVSVKKGEQVRRIYPRARVVKAWQKSKNTVYLVYPETAAVPNDQ